MADLGKEFLNTIKKSDQRKTTPFDAVGTVTRVKDGIAYVHFAGGVDETPVKLTINAQAGDEVQVRVADGRAWLVGNATSPPTDDAQARRAINLGKQANDAAVRATKDAMVAHEAAESASKSAREAKETTDEINAYAETAGKTVTQILSDGETAGTAAQQAKSAADKAVKDLSQVENVVGVINWVAEHGEMISQAGGTFDPAKVYFVVDPNGDYHIGNVYYSVVAEPKAEDLDDYYILNINESVQNYVTTHLYTDSEGLWLIPEAGGNKMLIATGAGIIYTTAGTYIIGKVNNVDKVLAKFITTGATVGQIDGAHSVIDEDGMQIYSIDSQGNLVELANIGYGEGNGGSSNTKAPYYSIGQRETGAYEYNPQWPYDLGALCYYNDDLYVCIVDIEQGEAWNPRHWQLAIGNYSYAEGYGGISSGFGSHTEGSNCKATGSDSHAEGDHTIAAGLSSHAQNSYTVAGYIDQTVIGTYNDNQQNNAFEIGNGTSGTNRSNAFAVDWDGDVEIALDTLATSGVDKEIYDALVKLGWDSDVII